MPELELQEVVGRHRMVAQRQPPTMKFTATPEGRDAFDDFLQRHSSRTVDGKIRMYVAIFETEMRKLRSDLGLNDKCVKYMWSNCDVLEVRR